MAKTRVLVVEDSLTVRKRLVEILRSDPDIDLVGEAEDGRRAIEICRRSRPDVITMDMMLPVMSGLTATEYIMAHCPTPILVVSASINRGALFSIYDSLAAGAVDVLEKPGARDVDGGWERSFLSTVKLVARIRVIARPPSRSSAMLNHSKPAALQAAGAPRILPRAGERASCLASAEAWGNGGMSLLGQSKSAAAARAPLPADMRRSQPRYAVVALGASTGGPGALVEVLRGLPAAFPLPILIVLHISEPFCKAFAEWLDGQTGRRVAFADDGELVASTVGRVMVAPGARHLAVRGGRLRLTLDPERYSCRPSVDVLFESVAQEYGAGAAACLLTGIGKDGALGLKRIRDAGGATIAQDETTSVVYGMPREAVRLRAATEVLRLGDIGPRLAALTSGAAAARMPEERP